MLAEAACNLAAIRILTMKTILRTEKRIAALCEGYVVDDVSFISMMESFDNVSVKVFEAPSPDFYKTHLVTLPAKYAAGHCRHIAFSDLERTQTDNNRWRLPQKNLYLLIHSRDAEPFIENPLSNW